ncbi:MAG TPA: AbrB/MazE/SpoVT family DNA-binding domain-containing protein [Spirochaetota bacterium]|nr:AbrB/MazE/SpoVT family DNA-binding domain-containing protein [Spirochaetota bacterium]
MLAKKTSKNQLTLPGEIVKEFPGINYFDVDLRAGKIVLTPVVMRPVDETLSGIREKVKKLGIAEKDVDAAIGWARKKKR